MHRVAAIGPTPHADVVQAWVDAGLHADMDWYTRTLDVRLDPRVRDPEARSVLVLAMDHAVTVPPDPGGLTGRVARYAWGRDYHNLIGKRLKGLRRDLREAGVANWGGVDTAPIVERAWAAASGLGYTGRNGVQIVPAHGSWMLLAVLFLDAVLEPDKPLTRDHCGACTRCLPACPTDAFVGPRVLDANRCIAYWTIESQDLPPLDLLDGFGRWVFGCDVCQEVCPHNAAAADGIEADFAPRHAWLDLEDLLRTDDDALMARFVGTPLRRPGAAGLKRNALIVLGNTPDPRAARVAAIGLEHADPVVRAAAVWARARHGQVPDRSPGDEDVVRNTWHTACDEAVSPVTTG